MGGQARSRVGPKDAKRHARRTGDVAVGQSRVTVFVKLQRPGPTVFNGIPKAVEGSDSGVAAPRERKLPRASCPDQLVVNEIRSQSDQNEVVASLSNDFVSRRKWNEVGEPFEGNRIAVVNVGRHGRFKANDTSAGSLGGLCR